jgi:hypothetical protein
VVVGELKLTAGLDVSEVVLERLVVVDETSVVGGNVGGFVVVVLDVVVLVVDVVELVVLVVEVVEVLVLVVGVVVELLVLEPQFGQSGTQGTGGGGTLDVPEH